MVLAGKLKITLTASISDYADEIEVDGQKFQLCIWDTAEYLLFSSLMLVDSS
jgi:hypothetical protein